jgi:hypothetical protein
MEKRPVRNYLGLDLLRGVGIFFLLWMHTAFYFFDGLYDLDLRNPPAIVTIIGLLLMFAGLFAMISGTAHVLQYHAKVTQSGMTASRLLRYNTVNGLLMLVIAWVYFLFTGPGLVNMEARTMNNSVLVALIRSGTARFSLERLLYVDSLVMIGMNLLLLAPLFLLIQGRVRTDDPQKDHRDRSSLWLYAGLLFFLLSLLRIPLYDTYLQALDQKHWGTVLLLNGLVNKNNPLLPYLSFGLLGGWVGALLLSGNIARLKRRVFPAGVTLFLLGAVLYVFLPDTMLQRRIDGKWFAIMIAQLGLFLLMMLLFLRVADFRKDGNPLPFKPVFAFFRRFGVAGLTPFFLESLLSAGLYQILRLIFPSLSFGLGGALAYGLILALLWGILLWRWERSGYRYGLEYWLCRLLAPFGHSAKQDKLSSGG